MLILLLVFIAAFVSSTFYIFHRTSQIIKDGYMDEIFHIPQARNYCDGNFTHWDPMITTLPGLYLTSVGIFKPVAALLNQPLIEVCSPAWLRATNVLFSLGNFYLIFAILKKLHNAVLDPDGVRLYMTTLALSLLPVLYFFTFLYYTDAGSTFFVLIMYLFCLHDSHKTAAAMGTVAILFRQTNIVWVVFCAGLCVRKELSLWMKEESSKKDIKMEKMSDYQLLTLAFKMLWATATQRRIQFIKLIKSILFKTYGYILVGIGFAVFIHLNGGIVVGDRTHHTVCLHFPQLFYFLSMTNFFAIFHLCSPYKIWDFLKFIIRHPISVVAFTAVSAALVHYFTYEHKYLLADNRHYTFYIWSKIYRRHEYVKYALIPMYYYFTWSFCSELHHRDVFWKMIYAVCLVLTTVPQKLLEFRYFILPYLIFRFNTRYGTALGLLHEILLVVAVNAATFYLFTEKPFSWPNQPGLQRFMW